MDKESLIQALKSEYAKRPREPWDEGYQVGISFALQLVRQLPEPKDEAGHD